MTGRPSSDLRLADLSVRWLGTVPYREALDLQRALFAGSSNHLLLLEHPHTYTLGVRADASNVLVDPVSVGADLVDVDRGGDVTYHGPGQLVGYPIVTLADEASGRLPSTRQYISVLEHTVMAALRRVGVHDVSTMGTRPGVWVEASGPRPRKIAAIGVRIVRGRTMHGFALNVDCDLAMFGNIVPCGISDMGVTSVREEGVDASLDDVLDALVNEVSTTWVVGPVDRSDVVRPRTVGDAGLSRFSRGEGPGDMVRYRTEPVSSNVRLTGRLAQAGVSGGVGLVDPKPEWMRAKVVHGPEVADVRRTLRSLDLVTVCEEAGCPNLSECWSDGTATFMLCGERCTRACGFCLVDTRRPEPLDPEEPERVARAVAELGLEYAVLTMVARDDLPDGGAAHVAETIRSIARRCPATQVEVLISDLGGDADALGHGARGRTGRAQPQHRDDRSPPAGGQAVGLLCEEPHRSGSIVDRRSGDEIGTRGRDGRDRRRGALHPGRSRRSRRRGRDDRPVPETDHPSPPGSPVVGARELRRVEALRRGRGGTPSRGVVAAHPFELSRSIRGRRPRGLSEPAAHRALTPNLRGVVADGVGPCPHGTVSAVTTAPASPFGARHDAVRRALDASGVDALAVSVGPDLPWLCGYEAMPLERLTMLVIPRGRRAVLVVPRLEAPRVQARPDFDIRPWGETEDPVAIVAGLLAGAAVVAIGDRTWARFVIELSACLEGTRLVRGSEVTGPLRSVKDDHEIEMLIAAGAAADRVTGPLMSGDVDLVGRTEAQVSADLAARLVEEGHARCNFSIVAAGEDAASPHHEPGQRVISVGDVVLCDIGGTLLDDFGVGYCSDITRCLWIGDPPGEARAAWDVLGAAHAAAIAAARARHTL